LQQVSAYLDLITVDGPDFTGRRTGVYQTIGSLDADGVPHVYEAWVQ
jgi:porin